MGGGVTLGGVLAHRYKQRVQELCQLEHGITYISGELRYRHLILADIFGKASGHCGQALKPWFLLLQAKLNSSDELSVQEIWALALDELRENTCLLANDLLIVDAIGMSLGVVDLDTQIKEFAIVIEQIHDARVTAEKGLANKMKIAISLCSVIAILLVILLI